MRKALLILLAVLLATGSLTATETAHQLNRVVDDPSFAGYAPNRIIVQLEQDITSGINPDDFKGRNALRNVAELEAVAKRFSISRIDKKFPGAKHDAAASPERLALTGFFRVHVENGNLDEVIAAYKKLPMVIDAYKIPQCYMDATPNDPSWTTQWNYHSTYGVDADQAWDIETGDATVVVGILDSGVEYFHGDLGGSDPPGPADNVTNGNIWVNTGEIPGNLIDDDGNDYVDDVIGWDFVETAFPCNDEDCGGADNDPNDGVGHGTHVAGTAAAINNNAYRVSGVAGGFSDGTFGSTANGVKILCCRIGWAKGPSGVVDMDYAAEAMFYVGDLKARGVNVAAINCSWGSRETTDLSNAIDYLVSQDVLVVVSAGNDNVETPKYIPSRDDCLSVGSTDINGNPSTFSNYGSWVDVAAPGTSILSTYAGGTDATGTISGTSMAAPHVVGVAALLESADDALSAQDKWDIICNPANVKPYNMTKYVGVGIVSALLALEDIEPCTDPPVAQFTAQPTAGGIPLEVSFTDQSTCSPSSWEWDFGDGSPLSYERNPVHTYETEDLFTVTLTAWNAYGNDSETKIDYIDAYEGGDDAVHVDSIDVWRDDIGRNCLGLGRIWIRDQNNQLVEGAEVFVTADGPTGGTGSALTNEYGYVTFQTPKTQNCSSGEWCFEVTNVVLTDYLYDSDANRMTRVCESGIVYKSGPTAQELMPTSYGLRQNYPNPFNPSTEISFSLPRAGHVKLEIFNIRGQKVATLVDGVRGVGRHTVTWDGSEKPSGIYLYRLKAGDYVENRKMILLK